jgi:hypothetical protein
VSLAAFDCVSIGAANLQTFSDLGRDVRALSPRSGSSEAGGMC